MPVPWETLVPYAVIGGLFWGMGVGGEYLQKRFANEGYYRRSYADPFDQMLIRRDMRLTGVYRRQSMNAKAPPEFATNSKWTAATDRSLLGRSSGLYRSST